MRKKFDRFRKTKQDLSILTARKDFQEKIVSLREEWGISTSGFSSEEENRVWHDKLIADSDKAIENGEPEVPINKFNKDLSTLCSELKLSANFISFTEIYLKFNKIAAPESINIFMQYNEELKQKELFVQIYKDTTYEDLKKAWSRIRKLKKYLGYKEGSRYKDIGNLKVEQRVYQLRQQEKEMTDKEIADELIKEGFKEYDYNYIEKLLSRYKKRIS